MKRSSIWLDLRFLTGVLFVIYGVLLMVYGLLFHPQTKTLNGWNIDWWWGIATFAFGVVFLAIPLWRWRSGKNQRSS
ncbi:hypothetical protein JIR001_03420 [Polycladomyces abyssicola]|uniref:Uncharacterized protein n=1 Tax=Polycladomyces abyssicola TaxID=1125966 RepID=A0A8D5UDX5_9BACL|nr:hypothetical protein [Polycladomyces abyssicola]BCU80559.1 hypothetical protein JIR001_03420 [Polycladomyces abyssicola]